MPAMAEDEDMYPNTDAQQYDYISNQPVQYPVPQQGQSQVSFASIVGLFCLFSRSLLPLLSCGTSPCSTLCPSRAKVRSLL